MSEESQEAKDARELDPKPIMSASGASFKTKQAARSAMKQKGFTFSTHMIIETDDGGFALKELPPQPKEEYWIVKFNQRANPQDTEDVQLIVNGEVLIMQREVEVIVPGRFLECADHATYNQYRSVPGFSHKVTSQIKTFPYSRIKQVTENEYLKAKTEGTKTVKKNIRKFGFDAAPDEVEE